MPPGAGELHFFRKEAPAIFTARFSNESITYLGATAESLNEPVKFFGAVVKPAAAT
jgi:hypothetical protein